MFFVEGAEAKGAREAAENRNYLAQRMTDEINEIIRVLQLTTYDEDEWDADNLTVMKKALNAIQSKMRAAHDWLEVCLSISSFIACNDSIKFALPIKGNISFFCLKLSYT